MAKSVLELAVGTGQWNAGLKKAKSALDNFTQSQGGLQQALNKDSSSVQKFVQMMGKMDSTAKTAKGQMNDYKSTIEQLTMQYNRMTDAQKKTVGNDYLQAIDQMKKKYQDVNREIQQMNQSLNGVKAPDVGGSSGGFLGGGKLSGMLQVFGGNLMTKAAGMAAGLTSEIGDAVKQGIELARQGEGIRIAFERLGRGDILDGLRQATHGTVTDIELMKAAVKFNDFKLPVEELGTMLAFAQQKAKDTGQSVDYMVDSIVTGLGRKSLMILDNLGLSATEVKDKMKQTGDMTKAVGEIIREQMSKAGDYVETAADKATKADVELKNAMEELGRTFQPLTDAGTSMWTSLKVGALDLLNTAIKPLIDAFTEAGRARAQFEKNNGSQRVTRQLGRLEGIQTDSYRRGTYKAQIQKYDTKIADYNQYLSDFKTWQNDKTAVGAYDRMQAFQKRTGLSFFSDVKAKLGEFEMERAAYVQGAQRILDNNPAPLPTDHGTGENGKKNGKGNTKTEITYAADSIAAQEAEVARLTKMWKEAGDAVRNDYATQLGYAKQKLAEMTGGFNPGNVKEIASTKVNFTQGTAPVAPAKIEFSEGLQNQMDQLTQGGKNATQAWNMASQAVANVGNAFASIEDPGMKAIGTVTQAIASIALGFAMASSQPNTAGTGWGWLAWLAAGAAAMATTISTIHSLTGYAQGGIVKGNSYSGDNVPAMVDGSQMVGLNAGEVVLTKAMAGNLAQQLQDSESRGQYYPSRVSGEQIYIALNAYTRRTGKGELVTWK